MGEPFAANTWLQHLRGQFWTVLPDLPVGIRMGLTCLVKGRAIGQPLASMAALGQTFRTKSDSFLLEGFRSLTLAPPSAVGQPTRTVEASNSSAPQLC